MLKLMLIAICTPGLVSSDQADDFGLIPGSVWEYTVTDSEGSQTYTDRAEKVVMVKGKPVLELTSRYGKRKPQFHYRAIDSEGCWLYHNANMMGPGVAADVAPEPLWKTPLSKGATWTWISPFRGQIMSNGEDVNLADLASDCTGKVVATNVEVVVPAGKYQTTQVTVRRISKGAGRSETTYWIASGVGIVREVDQWFGEYARTSERVLAKFLPGRR